jgi:hypothetical protein
MNGNVKNPKTNSAGFVSKSRSAKYTNAVTVGAFEIVCQLSVYQHSLTEIALPYVLIHVFPTTGS